MYEAISDHWATSEEIVAILVNDSLIDISTVAVAAIRSSRDALRPIHLWIDQVCINQDDIQERSRQVTLMSQIHSLARQVNVCLHCRSEGPKLLFEFAAVLHEQLHPPWWSVNKWFVAPCTPSNTLVTVLGSSLKFSHTAWSALAQYEECTEALVESMAAFLSSLVRPSLGHTTSASCKTSDRAVWRAANIVGCTARIDQPAV